MIYLNHYTHCGKSWTDEYDSVCKDKCPVCNKEVTPTSSDVMKEDVAYCPFCGGKSVVWVNTLTMRMIDSVEDPGIQKFTDTYFDEYQCQNESCGKSFYEIIEEPK